DWQPRTLISSILSDSFIGGSDLPISIIRRYRSSQDSSCENSCMISDCTFFCSLICWRVLCYVVPLNDHTLDMPLRIVLAIVHRSHRNVAATRLVIRSAAVIKSV